MTILKRILLTGYYQATRPFRAWNLRRQRAAGQVPLAVIFYHRIADDRANPWTTSTKTFLRQIAWLQGGFELISLEEVQRRIRAGRNATPAVSITFDDGYADNLKTAVPHLLERGIPFTYFVTVDHAISGRPFAHDLVRGHELPPNSVTQLRELAAAGVEIGSHCCTHANLGATTSENQLYHEVVDSRQHLQQVLGRPIRYFAFPFGQRQHLSRRAFHLAHQAGYEGVCTAYGALNYPGEDAFHLQRIGVDDDLLSLKNWLTGDPRKLRCAPFPYGELAQRQAIDWSECLAQ